MSFIVSLPYLHRYLIHPTHADPTPIQKFRTTEFLQGLILHNLMMINLDCPSESAPILAQILQSQAFFQFIEASVSISGWVDSGFVPISSYEYFSRFIIF